MVLGVNFFWNKLERAVITMVSGIRNSTHLLSKPNYIVYT